jgi:hypothetical protein
VQKKQLRRQPAQNADQNQARNADVLLKKQRLLQQHQLKKLVVVEDHRVPVKRQPLRKQAVVAEDRVRVQLRHHLQHKKSLVA